MADEVHLLSDDELRSKLQHYNLRYGPITRTTRKLFEKKLERAIRSSEGGISETIDNKSESEGQKVVTVKGCQTDKSCTSCTTSESSSELPDVIKYDTVHEVDQEEKKKDSTRTFYAVCLQYDEIPKPKTPLVFTEKSQALLSAKKNSGARFKAFSSRDKAEAFAYGSQGTPSCSTQASPVAPVDPIAKYKAPRPAEIVQFRKLIETGQVDKLSELIYQNPKYLISSGDTPVILQEGFRYNAMHVATKAGRKDVCKLLVDTLEDEAFWNLIYPSSTCNKDQNVGNRRKRFILDLYLNTPDRADKGLGDTPLHFACKYGRADVVEYLLSCSGIHKAPKNKNGETPQQIICSRAPTDCPNEVQSRIKDLFTNEETFFVPILRAEDNCSFPKLGVPSPDLFKSKYTVVASSPEDPRYKISAYAGPMSPQQADKFCFVLKSPHATPEEKVKFRNIKRSDSEKGLERVARKVAKSRNVGWCEYWKFLDKFTDLSTEDGLRILEEFLGRRQTVWHSDGNLDSEQTPNSDRHAHSPFNLNDCVFDEKMESTGQGTPTGRRPQVENFRNRLSWDDAEERNVRSKPRDTTSKDSSVDTSRRDSHIKDFSSTNGHVPCRDALQLINNDDVQERLSPPQDVDEEFPDSTSLRKLNFDEDIFDVSNCSEDSLGGLATDFARLRLSSNTPCKETQKDKEVEKCSGYKFVDPAGNSPTSNETKASDYEKSLFIEGFQPSKVDVDVLRAIKSVNVDADVFPNISRWQKLVRSFPKNDRQRWPGPGSPRFNQVRKAISKTWSC